MKCMYKIDEGEGGRGVLWKRLTTEMSQKNGLIKLGWARGPSAAARGPCTAARTG